MKETMNGDNSECSRDIMFAKYAYQILVEEIHEIKNVNEWAEKTENSRSYLNRCVKLCHKKTPNVLLRDVRYQRICKIVDREPFAFAKEVAHQVAPHWDGKRLSNFLTYYYDTNFTELNYRILNKKKKGGG